MIHRPLGQTGLQASILSYGASPLSSVFRPIDEAEGIDDMSKLTGVNLRKPRNDGQNPWGWL